MIIDPVKTELAIRQDVAKMQALLKQRMTAQAQIEHQIATLTQQRENNGAEIMKLEAEIARWESHLAPDPPAQKTALKTGTKAVRKPRKK